MPEDVELQQAQPVERPSSPKFDEEYFKKILIENNYVTPEDIQKTEAYISMHHESLFEYLIEQNIIAYDVMGQAMAKYYGVEFADLGIYQPSKEFISMIPPEIGQQLRVVVYLITEKSIHVTTDDPKYPGLIDLLVKILGNQKKIEIAYSLPDDLNESLIHYRKPLITRFNQIIKEQNRVAPEIIDEIIRDATAFKVSDIHLEPQEKTVLIRFRVDGVLQEAGQLEKQYYANILNRLKVLSRMRIDEHNMSQDGAIRYEVDGRPVNVRVSIVPTLDGEKVALRLLAEYSRGLNVKGLGLSPADKVIFDRQTHRPYGMVITSGPTGSGKTTTLYSLVKTINNPEINVTTIEDPVEYKIVGVNQIQVNPQTGLNFSEGLRAMLRQDPDVVLVGEIRDNDTAELAVNSALTGHLLFSTFHANDAASSIPRLLDMGVEPYLLASTLNLIIAQRLVRVIHKNCSTSFTVTMDRLQQALPGADKYFKGDEITLYRGKGCEGCNFTGFHGRTAIFELIEITPEMMELINSNPTTTQVAELAKKQGSHTLFADGIDKVKNGVTTLSELKRVAEPK